MAKVPPKPKSQVRISVLDGEGPTPLEKREDGSTDIVKSIVSILNGPDGSIERLAFDYDPSLRSDHAGVYRNKTRLIPNEVLRRVSVQNSCVASIVRGRQSHLAPFGQPRQDRFSNGFELDLDEKLTSKMAPEELEKWEERKVKATKLLSSCGHTKDVTGDKQTSLSQWLEMSVRDALVIGKIATEVVYSYPNGADSPVFHHFVAADAGTMYFPARRRDDSAIDQVRKEAILEMQRLMLRVQHPNAQGKEYQVSGQEVIDDEKWAWVQAVNGRPLQAFLAREMRVKNFYPATDIELDGYPITPIDTVIGAIVTHLNIGHHNRLYFQSGRATRGMLVIKSDTLTPQVLKSIKSKFNASINNVNNAWRMPVFGVGTGEEISWEQLDSQGSRDMEFQYLVDSNMREILTAFAISPDELTGYSYLSRGTNSQALSEGNNEYKLEAARDVGIRPILQKFEDFLNAEILPEIDAGLAEVARVRLLGLDADTPEKEATRTIQDSDLWMGFGDICERVEVDRPGREWADAIPLNEKYQALLFKMFSVGEIQEQFCGRKDASKDPSLAYHADDFWFKWQDTQMQQQQMQQAQMQQQQQGAAGGASGGGGGAPPQGGGSPPPGGGDAGGQPDQEASGGQTGQGAKAYDAQTEGQKSAASSAGAPAAADLSRSLDQAVQLMQKGEAHLPPELRRLLAQATKTSEFAMRGWENDLEEFQRTVMPIAEHHDPSKVE